MYLKIFFIISFTVLIIIMVCGVIKDLKDSEKIYKKEKLFFIKFSTKIPFLLSLYFIFLGKLSYNLPEIFRYGDKIYHFIFNDISYSISASIIATFLFLLATSINDLKKEALDITMTRSYLDAILNDLLKEQSLSDEYYETIKNEEILNYKKILEDIDKNKIDINYKNIKNITSTDVSLKRIKEIHWVESVPLKYWFNMVLINTKDKYDNTRAVLKGALECIVGIDKILEKPITYIYKELM